MTENSQWVDVLTAEQIEEHHSRTAELDPSFATGSRRFWESRTENELAALVHQAWLTNDGDQYQMARSYLAVLKNEDPPTPTP